MNLYYKTSDINAFGSAYNDELGSKDNNLGVKVQETLNPLLDKITPTSWKDSRDNQLQTLKQNIDTSNQLNSLSQDNNQLSALGGNMAAMASKQAVIGGAVNSAAQNWLPGAKSAVGKHLVGVGANMASDIAIDTIPHLMQDIKNGESANTVATNAAKNLGVNLAFDVGGDALGTGLDMLKKSKQTKQLMNQIANEAPTINKNVSNATMDQFSNLKPLQYGNVGNTASMVNTADDVTNIPLGNAKADVTPNYVSMEYSEIPYVKNQDAKNLLDSTVDRIKKDTDYALKTYKDGTDRTELVAQANKALDDFAMNPSEESYLNVIATRNKLNDSMQGTKYKSKRYKTKFRLGVCCVFLQ